MGSTGSACTSGALDPSHVLMAMGLSHEQAHGSLRLTLGRATTIEDIDFTVEALKEIVSERRAMSPLWEDYLKAAPALK
jgi:cysteine desulfurase